MLRSNKERYFGDIVRTLSYLLDPGWWMFEWRYWFSRTPWDTNITPPEVMEFLSITKPGRALDLGCGTGTNAITMAKHGWQVTAIDFSPWAIRTSRRKAARAGLEIDFRMGDVANLTELTSRYDYALDIGCLFTLKTEPRIRYAAGLPRLLTHGAQFMLYAWLPKPRGRRQWGINPEEVTELFAPSFELTRTEYGEEKWSGSAWYWLRKF